VSNRLSCLLDTWLNNRDKQRWVLATIIKTDGSSYRKAGAMMMINDLGQYYGLLSGGCLESDIMLQARRCWENGLNRIIEYDMREEEDLAWQLGIGCGGMVRILLQAVNKRNDYLKLDLLNDKLKHNVTCYYRQIVSEDEPENSIVDEHKGLSDNLLESVFVQLIKPAPHIAIFGGGVDAKPVAAIAASIGWRITLVDPRSSYARSHFFPDTTQIVRSPISDISANDWLQTVDVAFVMSHNITLDGQSLALLQNSSAKYVGLLGPEHRTDRVLESAGLSRDTLVLPLANPIGLRLGGELPESIALSMISEAHAFIEGTNARSISELL
jgi:xanthine/CO dehydrogenase XdhC/CoxF family maturation factor